MALGYREAAATLTAKNTVIYGMNDKDAAAAKAWVENRRTGEDGGPSLQVRATTAGETVQLLRFDMFYKQPHYHYAPNGHNIRYNLDPLTQDDGIGWVISLLRHKLPQLLAKAGQEGLASSQDIAAVAVALQDIETTWRAQEPAGVLSGAS